MSSYKQTVDMKDWQSQPLFKNRYTKTVAYELTPEEKELYDAVTVGTPIVIYP